MDRILRVNKVSLVELYHKVLAESPVKHRVVDDDLVVSRLQKTSKSKPLLRLDIVCRQLWPIDAPDIGQLVVQSHVRDDMRPAF